MQRLNEEEHLRKTQEFNVLTEAIEMYDSTTTKVVFIPALDEADEFYMNRTKVGLDYLSEHADEAKLQADTADYNAKRYSYLQNVLKDGIARRWAVKWLFHLHSRCKATLRSANFIGPVLSVNSR
jgi:hypothetical protein